jgi:hypothetical protein
LLFVRAAVLRCVRLPVLLLRSVVVIHIKHLAGDFTQIAQYMPSSGEAIVASKA